jgi:hypothetical protein
MLLDLKNEEEKSVVNSSKNNEYTLTNNKFKHKITSLILESVLAILMDIFFGILIELSFVLFVLLGSLVVESSIVIRLSEHAGNNLNDGFHLLSRHPVLLSKHLLADLTFVAGDIGVPDHSFEDEIGHLERIIIREYAEHFKEMSTVDAAFRSSQCEFPFVGFLSFLKCNTFGGIVGDVVEFFFHTLIHFFLKHCVGVDVCDVLSFSL